MPGSTSAATTSRARGPAIGVLRPLLGHRDHLHVELRPEHLVAELEVLHDLDRVRRGRGHEVVVVGEARGGAVVERRSRPRAASRRSGPCRPAASRRCWRRPGRGRRRRPALHVDLAEGRDVADADPLARRPDLARHRLEPVALARLGEPLGAQPEAGLDEDRAALRGPGDATASAGSAGNPCRGGGRRRRRSRPA